MKFQRRDVLRSRRKLLARDAGKRIVNLLLAIEQRVRNRLKHRWNTFNRSTLPGFGSR
jgi:hypothetical protein